VVRTIHRRGEGEAERGGNLLDSHNFTCFHIKADRTLGQVHRLIAPRDQKHQSNFVEFCSAPSALGSNAIARQNLSSTKIVYRRYAGLFFCVCVDANDNELAYLEAIHFFVEVLDQFFGNVCELDLVFNFYKVGGNRPVRRLGCKLMKDSSRSTPYSMRSSSPVRLKRPANKSYCRGWSIWTNWIDCSLESRIPQ
jgi:hypothetical protein